MKNPNVKYFQIPSKSQTLNPKMGIQIKNDAKLVILGFWICLVVLVYIGNWDFRKLNKCGGDEGGN